MRYLDGASRRTSGSGALVALAAATLFFARLTGLVAMDEVPLLLAAAYGLLSAVAFGMHGADKSAARQGTWRTPESTLHAIDLAGGWPGALVARRVFRHKTTKQPFRTVFWLTVTVNCAALAWFVSDGPTVQF